MAKPPQLPRLIIETLGNGYLIYVWDRLAFNTNEPGQMLPTMERSYVAQTFPQLVSVLKQVTTELRMTGNSD